MTNSINTIDMPMRSVQELRQQLIEKLAFLTGSSERVVTAIPGVLVVRRTAPSPPCSGAYQPSVIVVAQGGKRVDLGQASFVYDESRYLLTALDLPIVSQVVKASLAKPLLAMAMGLDMSIVRELLGREDVHVHGKAFDGHAMVTGQVTAPLLDASCRLLDLLSTPQDISFLSRFDPARNRVPGSLRPRRRPAPRAIATLRRSEPTGPREAIAWIKDNYTKPLRVDDLAADRSHGRVDVSSSLPGPYEHESAAVSKATAPAGCKGTNAGRWPGRNDGGSQRWL